MWATNKASWADLAIPLPLYLLGWRKCFTAFAREVASNFSVTKSEFRLSDGLHNVLDAFSDPADASRKTGRIAESAFGCKIAKWQNTSTKLLYCLPLR